MIGYQNDEHRKELYRHGNLVKTITLLPLLISCTTPDGIESMHHPEYTGDALNSERKTAITLCETGNTTNIQRYENVVNAYTQRGLVQQTRKANELAAYNEAVEN